MSHPADAERELLERVKARFLILADEAADLARNLNLARQDYLDSRDGETAARFDTFADDARHLMRLAMNAANAEGQPADAAPQRKAGEYGCDACHTATWCDHFKLCLSETSPDALTGAPLTRQGADLDLYRCSLVADDIERQQQRLFDACISSGGWAPTLRDLIAEVERLRSLAVPQTSTCPCGKGNEPWHFPRGGICTVGMEMKP